MLLLHQTGESMTTSSAGMKDYVISQCVVLHWLSFMVVVFPSKLTIKTFIEKQHK